MSRWPHSPGNLPTVRCPGILPGWLCGLHLWLGFPEPVRKHHGHQKRVRSQGQGVHAETPLSFMLCAISIKDVNVPVLGFAHLDDSVNPNASSLGL